MKLLFPVPVTYIPQYLHISDIIIIPNIHKKGTGYSEKFGKVTKDLWATGTSRCSNGLKSGPQLPCQLRLMKI